jgi:hypothetical protein
MIRTNRDDTAEHAPFSIVHRLFAHHRTAGTTNAT